jgi:hypothetical protein
MGSAKMILVKNTLIAQRIASAGMADVREINLNTPPTAPWIALVVTGSVRRIRARV